LKNILTIYPQALEDEKARRGGDKKTYPIRLTMVQWGQFRGEEAELEWQGNITELGKGSIWSDESPIIWDCTDNEPEEGKCAGGGLSTKKGD